MVSETEQYWSKPNGMVPNSRHLLVHRSAFLGAGEDRVVARFRENGWLHNWRYPGVDLSPVPSGFEESPWVYLIRTHSLDRRKLEFSGLFTVAGW